MYGDMADLVKAIRNLESADKAFTKIQQTKHPDKWYQSDAWRNEVEAETELEERLGSIIEEKVKQILSKMEN